MRSAFPSMLIRCVCCLSTLACCSIAVHECHGQSISEVAGRIDGLIRSDLNNHGQSLNSAVNDAQFARRVYLDVMGRIPTASELASYHNDQAAGHRARLIDRLLASDGYRSQMFNWLADMLRVRDEYSRTGQTYTFHTWIKEQIAANRPWDAMVHDMITASGRLGENGATGYLLRDAGMPLDSLSNTLTIFLGANVACAQCHDHPFAEWTQRDFYEMAAFFGATRFERDDPRKPAKAMRDEEFSKANLVTLLRPNMARVIHENDRWLKFPQDYAYDDAQPGDAVVPKFVQWSDSSSQKIRVRIGHKDQLRAQFADWLVSRNNPRFATAIANRLWKKLFGVAVQEPITDLDDKAQATNPKLLEYLTVLMVAENFDLRAFQRHLLNSETYQRQASPAPAQGVTYRFPGPLLRRMTAEQAWDSAVVLIRGPQVDRIQTDHSAKMRRLVIPGGGPMDAKSLIRRKDEIFAFARTLIAGKQEQRNTGRGRFMRIGKLRGDRAWIRASELPQPANPSHFLRIAGQSARDVPDDGSTEGGITEALAFMNGELASRLTGNQSLVMQQVSQEDSAGQRVELLYLSFLSRRPTAHELQLCLNALNDGLETADLAWALLNTREFLFIQ